MKKSRFIYPFLLAAAMVAFGSCGGKEEPQPTPTTDDPTPDTPTVSNKPSEEIQQADYFAQNALATYYLWNKEISTSLDRLSPDTCKAPITVVHDIRYHSKGQEVDHWTQLTNDFKSFTSSVQGLGLTYGYELQAGRITNKEGVYFLLVCYVVNDGPAQKAGLKRGDIIISLDGKDITSSNIYDAFNTRNVTLGITNLTSEGYIGPDVRSLDLTAVDMWEDPVLLDTTYVAGGKKVGYLVYNSFDLKSSETLPDVFRRFKKEGIEELIIDLRYNGGGYVFTERELASLIAPPANVVGEDVFQTEVYNTILADAWKRQGYDTNTYFSTKHIYETEDYVINEDVSDANPGIKKLYAIVTKGSASASEGLLVGLKPYMDITLVGRQTYGKYCAGWMMSPEELYGSNSTVDYSKIKNWGIYVMVSKFADKNGDNAAMPDGIPVNIEAEDNPFDGFQLGDENETMLKAALQAASGVSTKSVTGSRKPFKTTLLDHGMPRGVLIKTDIPSIIVND